MPIGKCRLENARQTPTEGKSGFQPENQARKRSVEGIARSPHAFQPVTDREKVLERFVIMPKQAREGESFVNLHKESGKENGFVILHNAPLARQKTVKLHKKVGMRRLRYGMPSL